MLKDRDSTAGAPLRPLDTAGKAEAPQATARSGCGGRGFRSAFLGEGLSRSQEGRKGGLEHF